MEPTAFIVETPHTPQAGHAVVLPTEYDPLDKLLDDALTFFEVRCPDVALHSFEVRDSYRSTQLGLGPRVVESVEI